MNPKPEDVPSHVYGEPLTAEMANGQPCAILAYYCVRHDTREQLEVELGCEQEVDVEITDEQIGQLANEAARAGDHAMVEVCEIALGAGSGIHATELEQRRARERCAEVISDAEAQS